MSGQESLSANVKLPPYFEAQEKLSGPESLTSSVNVIDALYLQDRLTGAADVRYVVGYEDGSLQTITGTPPAETDSVIKGQISALEVSQRGVFRGLTTENVSLFSVGNINPGQQTQGFNDPVELFGVLSAVDANGEAHRGILRVGRLDMLRAYRVGVTFAFKSMSATAKGPNACMIPFHLPAGPEAAVRGGDNLVLAYPMFTPDVYGRGDNSYLTMLTVYDLLSQLQQDMRTSGVKGALTNMIVPAPSRSHLEAELRRQGYDIQGDTAIYKGGRTFGASAGILKRLREIASDYWSAERIQLPQNATHRDYCAIIDQVCADVATPADRSMANAVEGNLRARMSYSPPRPPQPKPAPAPQARPVVSPSRPLRTVQPPAPPVRRPVVHVPAPQRPVPAVPKATPEDWRQDFLNRPVAPAAEASNSEEWAADFVVTRAVGTAAVKAAASKPAPKPAAEKPDWASDFQTPTPQLAPPAPPEEDWKNDFVTGSAGAGNEAQKPKQDSQQPPDDWTKDFE